MAHFATHTPAPHFSTHEYAHNVLHSLPHGYAMHGVAHNDDNVVHDLPHGYATHEYAHNNLHGVDHGYGAHGYVHNALHGLSHGYATHGYAHNGDDTENYIYSGPLHSYNMHGEAYSHSLHHANDAADADNYLYGTGHGYGTHGYAHNGDNEDNYVHGLDHGYATHGYAHNDLHGVHAPVTHTVVDHHTVAAHDVVDHSVGAHDYVSGHGAYGLEATHGPHSTLDYAGVTPMTQMIDSAIDNLTWGL